MKSKHKKAQFISDKGLFIDLNSFTDLENRIFELPQDERGCAFEVFAEAYFKTQALHQAQEVWPDSEIPQSVRNELGLPPTDMGIDGVFKTHDGKYHAYQVKYRTNRLALYWDELSTFMGLSDRSDKRVLFTNSNDISSVMDARTDFYSIKGNDLDRLDRSDFQAIENLLKTGSVMREKKSPRPHQLEATKDILNELKINARTTATMACATGKTLVALWAAEKRGAQTILVLLPSLALVRQTLHDWAKENNWDNFNYLCICSDKTVNQGEDEIILNQHDLDFAVTTDKTIVERFLKNQIFSRKIIFSTYQSCQIIPKGFTFDFGVFDEAHKTAGREGTNFAYALKDENISIAKRLFLTATPRHYNVNKKDKEGNQTLVFSMDDPTVYGRICHKLSFASAAKQGIICNYKVIISLVVSEEVDRELLKRGEVIINGDPIKAQRVANLLALTNAVERYNVKRVFTFHNSVKAAQSFTNDSSEGISTFLNDFQTFHVNGEMPTSKRELIMKEFKEAPKAVMSNARCLTEGVDVPAVDMVAFISPKKSQIDIVQATGRAMRKSDGKEYGYILIPIFLELASGESIEQALEKTQFDDIWNVLQTLQEHDESLCEIIGQMREDIGRTGGYDDSRLREKLELIGPEIQLPVLRSAITTKIVERLGSTWDERFGELCKFKALNGHCNVPENYIHNVKLAVWVNHQRQLYRKRRLLKDQLDKLNKIEFDWNPIDTFWENMAADLQKFKELNGHCNVPQNYTKNEQLGTWVGQQRQNYKKDRLSKERINRLNQLGFVWKTKDYVKPRPWNEWFSDLQKFKELNGHCNVPQNYTENKQLGTWVGQQRQNYKKCRLSKDKIKKLADLGLEWDPMNSAWENMVAELQKFKDKNGHCNVPNDYTENKQLGTWTQQQRKAYKKESLSSDRIEKLKALDFVFDIVNTAWELMYLDLCSFKKEHGHLNIPRNNSKNLQLISWINGQRSAYKKNKISSDRIEKLENIGFCWTPLDEYQEKMFQELSKFKEKNGHCNVPKQCTFSTLGSWVRAQRNNYKYGTLSSKMIAKLNAIEFNWDSTDSWEILYQTLCEFKHKYGHCNVPCTYSENIVLARWVSMQRQLYKNGKLLPERYNKLLEIGFTWDPFEATWNERFDELVLFKEKNGHCNVPLNYPDNCSLGTWVGIQRNLYNSKCSSLTSERIQKLNKIGFIWAPLDMAWEKMLEQLSKYKKENGNCDVPKNYAKNIELSRWLVAQRGRYNKGKLSQERFEKLNKLGFNWDPFAQNWEENFDKLCAFKRVYGNCLVPNKYPTDQSLATWVGEQRKRFKKGHLSQDRFKKLEDLGFDWDPIDTVWHKMFNALELFKKEYGHCRVPDGYPQNKSLAIWVATQRYHCKKKWLAYQSIEKLNKIGFDWNPINSIWEAMFTELQTYNEQNGHCNVPSNYPETKKLAAWVGRQRQGYKRGKLSQYKIDKLNKIGFKMENQELIVS